jgi:hypothetical protein
MISENRDLSHTTRVQGFAVGLGDKLQCIIDAPSYYLETAVEKNLYEGNNLPVIKTEESLYLKAYRQQGPK